MKLVVCIPCAYDWFPNQWQVLTDDIVGQSSGCLSVKLLGVFIYSRKALLLRRATSSKYLRATKIMKEVNK
jgi:hypothetical protein